VTVSDLPVEGPPPAPVHPTSSSTQPASHKPTDTDGAAARSWTYTRLRTRSPEAASAATRAVRELASIVLILTKAVEGVVDTLTPTPPRMASSSGYSGYSQPLVDAWEDE